MGFFDVFFFQKASTKNKKTCFGANRLEGEKLLMMHRKQIIQAMQLFQDDIFEEANPSRNEDTASFLGHIPGAGRN